MPDSVGQYAISQFESNVELLSQQFPSLLRSAVMEKKVTGVEAYFNRFGSLEATRRTNRVQPTNLQEGEHSRRRVTVFPYDIAVPWDGLIDGPESFTNPTGEYSMAMMGALNRMYDDVIIAAFGAVAYEGRLGERTVQYDATQVIPDAADPMTLQKLLQIRKRFKQRQVDMTNNQLYLAYSAEQEEDLLSATEIGSRDYNIDRVLVNGEVDTFAGIKFIQTERLQSTGNIRHCWAFTKQGMGFAFNKPQDTKVTERNDLSHVTQIFMSASAGAVRKEDAQVLRVDCVE